MSCFYYCYNIIGSLGNHRAALTLLSIYLRDFRAAEQYCEEQEQINNNVNNMNSNNNSNNNNNVSESLEDCSMLLLDMYLNPRKYYEEHQMLRRKLMTNNNSNNSNEKKKKTYIDGNNYNNIHSGNEEDESIDLHPMYDPAIALISSKQGMRKLNPLTLLTALTTTSFTSNRTDDDDGGGSGGGAKDTDANGSGGEYTSPPLIVVFQLLSRILREQKHKVCETKLRRSLEKKINLETVAQVSELHKQRIVINEYITCGECGVRLGNKTVFTKFPEIATPYHDMDNSSGNMNQINDGSVEYFSGKLMCYKCYNNNTRNRNISL